MFGLLPSFLKSFIAKISRILRKFLIVILVLCLFFFLLHLISGAWQLEQELSEEFPIGSDIDLIKTKMESKGYECSNNSGDKIIDKDDPYPTYLICTHEKQLNDYPQHKRVKVNFFYQEDKKLTRLMVSIYTVPLCRSDRWLCGFFNKD